MIPWKFCWNNVWNRPTRTLLTIFSIAGGVTLLAYAIHRQDPVFIIGQGMGLLIYFRNLQFLWRDRNRRPPA